MINTVFSTDFVTKKVLKNIEKMNAKKIEDLNQKASPLILLARLISWSRSVTLLACLVQRKASS